jgi:hypothetical protein
VIKKAQHPLELGMLHQNDFLHTERSSKGGICCPFLTIFDRLKAIA